MAGYMGGDNYEIQDYVIDQWSHIKIEANLTEKYYKIFIDGIQVSGTYNSTTLTEFPIHPTVTPTVVLLGAGNSGKTKMWFDDVKLYDTSGIVAYYPFNGNADDYSGSEHHGTIYGATLTDDKNGNAESAYYFDGIDDYIDIGDWENGGAMSFTFWVRWDATQFWSRIIDLGNGADDENIIIANKSSGSEFFFGVYDTDIYEAVFTSTITTSLWDFYTATVDASGVMTIYKNAIQIGQNTDGFIPNFLMRTNQYIGKSNFLSDDFFNGAIDDLRIYDKELSLQEITDIYSSSPLDIEENISNGISLYMFDDTMFTSDVSIKYTDIQIYNTLGQCVFQKENPEFPLPLNRLQAGVYIIKAKDITNLLLSKKIIIK